MHRNPLVLAIPCALLAAVACAPQNSEKPDDRLPEAVALPVRISLPFDTYRWNPYEMWLLEQARYRLVKRCVEDRGLDFTMPEKGDRTDMAKFYDNSRRYGVVDEKAAALFGYHLPVSRVNEERRIEVQAWAKKVSGEEEAAIYGKDENPGCYRTADSILGRGVPPADTDWLGRQSEKTLLKTEQGKSVGQARAAWKTCMSKAGFTYAHPDKAIGDPHWDLDSPEITQRELRTARADTACKRSSGLLERWHTTEVAEQRRVIERDPGKFTSLKANKDGRLRNVRRALST